MEMRRGFNQVRPCVSLQTVVCLDRLECVDVATMAMGQGLVGQRPQPLGRWPCGRLGGQEVERRPCGHGDVGADVPARPVEPHQHWLARTRADRLGTRGQGACKRGHRDRGPEHPPRPAGAWMRQGVARAPLVALWHQRPRALPARAPDAAQDGREAEAVWVGRPPCSLLCRVGLLPGVDYGREVFLKAAWAIGSALVWRGRGTLAVQPRRRQASHPRWAGTRRPRVAAIQAAAFGPVHTPPSGGGCVRAAASAVRWAAARSPPAPGLRRRRSSTPAGPCGG
jgi:hypothetical protein